MMVENYQVNLNQFGRIKNQKTQQFYFEKIEKRLKATIKQNKKKDFYNKFTLRNCCVDDQIPERAIKLLNNCPKLKKLRQFQLSEMGLKFLKNIPSFPLLVKLDLTMNMINDEQIKYIFIYQNLEILYLTENFIKNVQTVESLKKFRKLKELDISANPVESLIQKSQAFGLIPGLKVYNRYLQSGRDLERNDLFDQSDEQEEQSEDQNSNSFNQDYYEPSNIVYDSGSQDQRSKFIHQMDEQPKKQQDSQEMIEESESSQVAPPKRQKKLNQMTNQELKIAYEQSKIRLRKLLQQMR